MDIYRVTIADKKSGRPEHRLWLNYYSAANCYHYWRNVVWRQRDAEGKEEMYHPYQVTWEKLSTVESDWAPVNKATESEVRRLLTMWTRFDDATREQVRKQLDETTPTATPAKAAILVEQPVVLTGDEKEEAFRRLSMGEPRHLTVGDVMRSVLHG